MNYKTLLLSGGGTLGVAYCGVLRRLQEKGDLKFERIMGVSVGSIFGLIIVLNYDYKEIEEELMRVDFKDFNDIRLKNFINKYGLDSGNKVIKWIEKLLKGKGYDENITFEELYKETKIKFQVCATNLTRNRLETFDYTTVPKMRVTEGIRMSIAIPFVYTSVKYNNEIYVDGGIIDNFPIHLVEDEIEQVLGIRLLRMDRKKNEDETSKIDNIYEFSSKLVSCFLKNKEEQYIKSSKHNENRIVVKYIYTGVTGDAGMPNVILQNEEKRRLIEIGYNEFLI